MKVGHFLEPQVRNGGVGLWGLASSRAEGAASGMETLDILKR